MLPAGGATSRGAGVAVVISGGIYAMNSESEAVGELKLTRCKPLGQRSIHPHYDIRQYMSYKIVHWALMNHINKDCEINIPSSPSLTPSSLAMSAPQRLTPGRLPDPWLLDTESLLSELGRVRGLARNIPAARNDILGPINTVIDALWDLEEPLRYCFHLHCEAQRSFAKKHANSLPANQIPKQHRPAASRTATVRRRRRHSA